MSDSLFRLLLGLKPGKTKTKTKTKKSLNLEQCHNAVFKYF